MSCHTCKRTGIRECNPAEAEVKCMVCGFCEREYVKKVANFQTIMPVECVYCRTIFDHKDGLGLTDITSGTCPACMLEHERRLKS